MFMGIWIYLRHWINWKILWATLTEFRTVGPFELNWETQQYKCWISQYITFALLACLQAVNLFWLFLILRIAKNYVFTDTSGPVDERSDDEDDDEGEEEIKEPERQSSKSIEGAALNGNKPVVLLNGEPVGNEAKTPNVRERRKKG
jgi:very-long-chain ceramide synthase